MAYTVRHDDTTDSDYVRDGGIYIGSVSPRTGDAFRASLATKRPQDCRCLADLPTREDAIEWLVCEHRDIPWADRPECQRVEAA